MTVNKYSFWPIEGAVVASTESSACARSVNDNSHFQPFSDEATYFCARALQTIDTICNRPDIAITEQRGLTLLLIFRWIELI